jgi:hypothetical protein
MVGVLLNIEDRRTGAQCRVPDLLPHSCGGKQSELFV